jgi:hypothetical protein
MSATFIISALQISINEHKGARDLNSMGLTLSSLFLFFLALTAFSPPCHATLNCGGCHGKRDINDLRPIDAPARSVTDGGLKGTHQTHTSVEATTSRDIMALNRV